MISPDVEALMAAVIAAHNAEWHPGRGCAEDDEGRCAAVSGQPSRDEITAARRVRLDGLVKTVTFDPFTPTPPSAVEEARVRSDAALLTAAADPINLLAAGVPTSLIPELAAWLRSAARDAAEVGSDMHAVALARKVMGEWEW